LRSARISSSISYSLDTTSELLKSLTIYFPWNATYSDSLEVTFLRSNHFSYSDLSFGSED
jgi:hypothetical protein